MLVGGPNTQFDVRKWRRAFELTVHKLLSTPQDIAATADRLRKIIADKPARGLRGVVGVIAHYAQ